MLADAPWIADLLGGGAQGDGAHLVGHSWGGAEALLAVARRPAAVRSLVLVEPALHALLADGPAVRTTPALQQDLGRTTQALMAARTSGGDAIVRSPNHFPRLANADEFNRVLDAFMREADRARNTGTN